MKEAEQQADKPSDREASRKTLFFLSYTLILSHYPYLMGASLIVSSLLGLYILLLFHHNCSTTGLSLLCWRRHRLQVGIIIFLVVEYDGQYQYPFHSMKSRDPLLFLSSLIIHGIFYQRNWCHTFVEEVSWQCNRFKVKENFLIVDSTSDCWIRERMLSHLS